ncbi:MAG: hypothetical protein WCP97_08210 [bacterium]
MQQQRTLMRAGSWKLFKLLGVCVALVFCIGFYITQDQHADPKHMAAAATVVATDQATVFIPRNTYTLTATPTFTPSLTPIFSYTITQTLTHTPTFTPSLTPIFSYTITNTFTPTNTPQQGFFCEALTLNNPPAGGQVTVNSGVVTIIYGNAHDADGISQVAVKVYRGNPASGTLLLTQLLIPAGNFTSFDYSFAWQVPIGDAIGTLYYVTAQATDRLGATNGTTCFAQGIFYLITTITPTFTSTPIPCNSTCIPSLTPTNTPTYTATPTGTYYTPVPTYTPQYTYTPQHTNTPYPTSTPRPTQQVLTPTGINYGNFNGTIAFLELLSLAGAGLLFAKARKLF